MRRVALALVLLAGLARAEGFESTQWVMGTTLRVAAPEAIDPAVLNDAFARVRAAEDLLSTWRDDTALAAFNRAPAGASTVDAALVAYVMRVQRDHARTRGAFDPSVGTLRVDAHAPLGMDRLRWDGDRPVKPHAAFALDSGGDGKGVGVDRMMRVFTEAGVADYLIDFGGSSWAARGNAPDGAPWRVALAHEADVVGTLELGDRALSISSTVQVDLGEDGARTRRFHLIDPRTRGPVEVSRTVAVFAPTAVEAEVISTALAVDGHEAARVWLDAIEAIEVVVIEDAKVVVSGPSFSPRGDR